MFEEYKKTSPKRTPLSPAFAFSSFAHMFATFFGCGLLCPAAGTWGTAAGLLFYILLSPHVSPYIWFWLILGTFFVGAWACDVSGKDCGVHDHTSFVIDEVFAIWCVLLTVPNTLPWQLAAFAAFRFFDIVKIPPVSWIDKKMLNGFGVMADDAVAALYAILLLRVVSLL